MGFTRIRESVELAPGFTLTAIRSSTRTTRSASSGGTVLVDLNDAKPLPRIKLLRRVTRVDARSHSGVVVPPAHVRRSSFVIRSTSELLKRPSCRSGLDMIPFASSVCHLHAEVLHENDHLATPVDLEQYWSSHRRATTLTRMPHGSTWSNDAVSTSRRTRGAAT
jgi:hypothetical protein